MFFVYLKDSSEPYCSSTTCSISPISFVSDTSQKTENGNYAEDTTSSDSLTSNTSNIKTGGTMRSLARIFRRSSSKQYMPAASFCGYSLDRDYWYVGTAVQIRSLSLVYTNRLGN